jgi:hypothetical protein
MSTTPKTPASPVVSVKSNVEATVAPVTVSSPSATPVRKASPAKPVAKAAAVKSAAKPAAKPLAKAFAQSAKPAKAEEPAKSAKTVKPQKTVQAEKPAKPKKLKLISDKFTLLKEEFAVLEVLKKRAAKAALPAKKSALLRAGIQALAAMNDAAFATALGSLPATKPAPTKPGKA